MFSRIPRYSFLCFTTIAAIAYACPSLAATKSSASKHPLVPVITVNTDYTVCPSYNGLGVQWDPSFVDYTAAQWQRIFQRVSILQPQFIRCCYMATSYCTGFKSNGQPIFNWNSVDMRRVYPILDYCQAHHITVLLGEWGPPFGMKVDDPRWSTLIADELNYLIHNRGYTCIPWFNKQNEPTGDDAYFQQWRISQLNLQAAITRAKLGKYVKQVGPDTSGEGLFAWLKMCAEQLPQALGEYELHWYATDDNIASDHVESSLRVERKLIDDTDPDGKTKPFILGESGTSDTLASQTGNWSSGDSNVLIRSPRYGTLMADYAVQTMRAGLAGMSAWDLDDAMHEQMGARSKTTVRNPNGYNLKVWGFWNTLGTAMGEPSDVELRPWFYTWTMLSRHFPQGSRIVLTNNPNIPGVRSSAALITHNGVTALSIAVVNDSDTARNIKLVVPNIVGTANIRQFDYSQTAPRATAAGMPMPLHTLQGANLSTGIIVDLPAQGMVVLTTLHSKQTLKLTTGRVARTTQIQLASADGTDVLLPGTTVQFHADVQPEQVPVTWRVTSPNGAATRVASVDKQGRLTGRLQGSVLLIATSSAPGNVKSVSVTVHVMNSKTITDYPSNWSKIYSHTSGLTFDNQHASQFEGQAIRVKRLTNTPQSIEYNMYHLTSFRVKAFYTGQFNDQVTIAVSADGIHWHTAQTVHSTTETTSDFKPTYITPAAPLPPANFLRITLQNNPVVYAPQLAEVTLKASVSVH